MSPEQKVELRLILDLLSLSMFVVLSGEVVHDVTIVDRLKLQTCLSPIYHKNYVKLGHEFKTQYKSTYS